MSIGAQWAWVPTNLAASALVRTGPGVIGRIVVNSATTGTLTLWDSLTATGTKIVNAMVLTPGAFVTIEATFQTGLFATIGGTADITVLWIPA